MDDIKNLLVGQFKALRPSFISKKPHFNFISAHYFYIIGLIILGSVIVFGAGRGNIAYIDALFFASGSCTQAGLNTVDINQLNTFQQIVLYLWPMMTNPITINSFVVFLRLYWFEKRFQHIARDSRQKRGTISKSKRMANLDDADAEKGVGGRKITVMLNGAQSRIGNDGTLLGDQQRAPSDEEELDPKSSPPNHSAPNGDAAADETAEPRRPEIKFARTVTKSDGLGEDALKLPPARTEQEHIAILERQRKRDDEVLRIPNPRDVERGMVPKRVEAGDEEEPELAGPPRARGDSRGMNLDGEAQDPGAEDRPQAITIEEPDRRKLHKDEDEHEREQDDIIVNAKAAAHTFSFLKLRRPRFLSRTSKRFHGKEDELHTGGSRSKGRRQSFSTLRTAFSRDKVEGTPYLSWEPTIGRNSAFLDLTEEQREELGGIEYRSLKTLALILTGYFWGFSLLGVIGLLPWILHVDTYGQVIDADGQSRTWWAFFTPNSAFMDLGFTLTPDSMSSFSAAVWPLLLLSFLVVIGNTGFPVLLRFIIWVTSHLVPVGTGLYEELRFLLDHPRRCFTLLFPSGATWWLFWLLVVMNGLDLIFFIVLDLGSGPVVDLPPGLKVLNGLFEAVSTRTAGFTSVNLAALHPAVQFSYMVMMYISVFPIAISVRRTNVYEEKSLGVYTHHDDEEHSGSDLSYVGAHLRRQLSFDLWYIVIGFFILSIAEGPRIMAGDFSQFSMLFEVVSAYGTVGMSLGYPTVNASLSSQFSVIGKLVIIAMMIRGRHRGLPYGLDRAILLPSESLNASEAADADAANAARMARLQSHTSAGTTTAAAGAQQQTPQQQLQLPRAATRRKSFAGAAADHANILTSLLHPGPAVPAEPLVWAHHRRKSSEVSRGGDVEEGGQEASYATRVSSRRTEPGAGGTTTVRRAGEGVGVQRPRTSAGDD